MRYRLALVALTTALPLFSCRCGGERTQTRNACETIPGNQPDHPGTCAANNECADHYVCGQPKDRADLQCCLFADRKCNTEADCCPGQTCVSDRHLCWDKFLECDGDE